MLLKLGKVLQNKTSFGAYVLVTFSYITLNGACVCLPISLGVSPGRAYVLVNQSLQCWS